MGNIPQGALDNNILKEKENVFFNNSLSQEVESPMSEEEVAKVFIDALGNNPAFRGKVRALKEKF